jgi:hypothetical protein
LDVALVDEEPMAPTEATLKQEVGSDESYTSDNTGDNGNASDNGGRVKIGAEADLAGMSFDFGRSKVMRGRILDVLSSYRFFPKGFARPPGIESIPVPKGDEVVVFEDFFLLLAFAYLRTLCFWIFFTNFGCSYINLLQMLLFKSANLFGLSRLAEVALMLKFLLITMSYIIKTRRFILRGPRLPSLLSLGVYPFIHLDLGIGLGLLRPCGIH